MYQQKAVSTNGSAVVYPEGNFLRLDLSLSTSFMYTSACNYEHVFIYSWSNLRRDGDRCSSKLFPNESPISLILSHPRPISSHPPPVHIRLPNFHTCVRTRLISSPVPFFFNYIRPSSSIGFGAKFT